MERVLGRFSPYFFAVLRIVAGAMFLMHGTQKLLGWPGGKTVPVASLFGVAGIIEMVCGTLLIIGLFGSFAAFIACGEMVAAYFIAHAGRAIFPIQNQGELAVLYCVVYLYIASRGSGIWSVDSIRRPALQRARGPILYKQAS
jgi:putative oxidoreductase